MSYSALNAASFGELLQALSETQYQDYTVNSACSNCGECCSNLLPMTRREIDAIKRHVKRHGIKPQKHFIPARNPALDMVCPFRGNANRRCAIYDVRPRFAAPTVAIRRRVATFPAKCPARSEITGL